MFFILLLHVRHLLKLGCCCQVMLQAGGIGCAAGGVTGCFTPMWLMVGKKPTEKSNNKRKK
jgi:hypothetical protein